VVDELVVANHIPIYRDVSNSFNLATADKEFGTDVLQPEE